MTKAAEEKYSVKQQYDRICLFEADYQKENVNENIAISVIYRFFKLTSRVFCCYS